MNFRENQNMGGTDTIKPKTFVKIGFAMFAFMVAFFLFSSFVSGIISCQSWPKILRDISYFAYVSVMALTFLAALILKIADIIKKNTKISWEAIPSIFLSVGVTMFIFMIIYLIYVFSHWNDNLPWSFETIRLIYKIYLLIMGLMLFFALITKSIKILIKSLRSGDKK